MFSHAAPLSVSITSEPAKDREGASECERERRDGAIETNCGIFINVKITKKEREMEAIRAVRSLRILIGSASSEYDRLLLSLCNRQKIIKNVKMIVIVVLLFHSPHFPNYLI